MADSCPEGAMSGRQAPLLQRRSLAAGRGGQSAYGSAGRDCLWGRLGVRLRGAAAQGQAEEPRAEALRPGCESRVRAGPPAALRSREGGNRSALTQQQHLGGCRELALRSHWDALCQARPKTDLAPHLVRTATEQWER